MAGVHLGPGTLYGALSRLESQGLIEPVEAEGRRRPYRITGAGAELLRERLRTIAAVAETGLTRLRAAPDGGTAGHGMSARRSRARLGAALLALYPEPWRDRYGEEMRALIEDDPPGARGFASLLAGAAQAHVRPQRCWRAEVAPATAMRLSVGALFACWMLVSLAGSAFAKLTEHIDPV